MGQKVCHVRYGVKLVYLISALIEKLRTVQLLLVHTGTSEGAITNCGVLVKLPFSTGTPWKTQMATHDRL
jgi:hypothetical protein